MMSDAQRGWRHWSTGIVISVLFVVGACVQAPPTEQEIAEESRQAGIDQIMRIADSTREGGDVAAAAGLYRRAHQLAPEQVAPLIALGETNYALQSYPEAAKAYAKAIELDPDDAKARYGYGKVLRAMGRSDQAVEEFRAAVRLNPEDPRAQNGLGVALDRVGRHAEAREAYGVGAELSPSDLGLQNNIAFSYLLSGEFDEAIKILEEMADDPLASPRNRQNLALAYGLAGEDEKARVMARRDLNEAQVENNLAYYVELRNLSGRERRAALLGVEVSELDREEPSPGLETAATTQPISKPAAPEPRVASTRAATQTTQIPPEAIGPPVEVVVLRRSNLRSQPGPQGRVLAKVNPGDRMMRTTTMPIEGYYRVDHSAGTGWIWYKNLRPVDAPEEERSPAADANTPPESETGSSESEEKAEN